MKMLIRIVDSPGVQVIILHPEVDFGTFKRVIETHSVIFTTGASVNELYFLHFFKWWKRDIIENLPGEEREKVIDLIINRKFSKINRTIGLKVARSVAKSKIVDITHIIDELYQRYPRYREILDFFVSMIEDKYLITIS